MIRALCIVLALGACAGPSERIAANTAEVRQLATSSGKRFERIVVQAESPHPDIPAIHEQATAGHGEQSRILDLVDYIYIALTGVEDSIPWWVRPLCYVCIALSIIGVVLLVWHLGIGRFVKGWLGVVTPTERASAELAAHMIDMPPERAVQAVERLRRSDRTFDAAFRRTAPIQKRRKKKAKS